MIDLTILLHYYPTTHKHARTHALSPTKIYPVDQSQNLCMSIRSPAIQSLSIYHPLAQNISQLSHLSIRSTRLLLHALSLRSRLIIADWCSDSVFTVWSLVFPLGNEVDNDWGDYSHSPSADMEGPIKPDWWWFDSRHFSSLLFLFLNIEMMKCFSCLKI